jgi:LAS superfamily LD-carboxypeptidase LdcB
MALTIASGPLASATADPGQKQADVRRERAAAAARLDALKADRREVGQALHALQDNLDAQRTLVARASRAEAEAGQAAAVARQAEAEKLAAIGQLEATARTVALNLYMGRADAGLASLLPGTDVSVAIYRSALGEVALGGARVTIDGLGAAREDLTVARDRAEAAERESAHRKLHATEQSQALDEAIALSQRKQGELDERVEQNLAEAASLATLDAQLSKEIAAREAAIAAELRKSQQRAAAAGAGWGAGRAIAMVAGSGNLVVVGGITVDASIADALARLLVAAAADGFVLGGGGYRSADEQIAVRRNNCGPSQYDIWQKPASQCQPPAARPGTSMHERGLAIDFTCNGVLVNSYGSACFAWLRSHALGVGFRNRPGEPWHWSPNGH